MVKNVDKIKRTLLCFYALALACLAVPRPALAQYWTTYCPNNSNNLIFIGNIDSSTAQWSGQCTNGVFGFGEQMTGPWYPSNYVETSGSTATLKNNNNQVLGSNTSTYFSSLTCGSWETSPSGNPNEKLLECNGTPIATPTPIPPTPTPIPTYEHDVCLAPKTQSSTNYQNADGILYGGNATCQADTDCTINFGNFDGVDFGDYETTITDLWYSIYVNVADTQTGYWGLGFNLHNPINAGNNSFYGQFTGDYWAQNGARTHGTFKIIEAHHFTEPTILTPTQKAQFLEPTDDIFYLNVGAQGLNGNKPEYKISQPLLCLTYVNGNSEAIRPITPVVTTCSLPQPFTINNLNIGDWIGFYWCQFKAFITTTFASFQTWFNSTMTTLFVPNFKTGSDLSELSAEVKTLLTTKSPLGYVFFWINYDWDSVFTAVPDNADTRFAFNIPVIGNDNNISANPIQLDIDLKPDDQVMNTVVMIKNMLGYIIIIPFALAIARLAMTAFGITKEMTEDKA